MKHGETRRSLRITVALLAAVVASLLMILVAGSAAAQKDPYGNGGPQVRPTLLRQDREPPAAPLPSRRGLPITGADLTLFVATGATAIGTGALILRSVRSRRERG